jgi:hypothetical protein
VNPDFLTDGNANFRFDAFNEAHPNPAEFIGWPDRGGNFQRGLFHLAPAKMRSCIDTLPSARVTTSRRTVFAAFDGITDNEAALWLVHVERATGRASGQQTFRNRIGQLNHFNLGSNPEHNGKKNLPPDLLALSYDNSIVFLFGWRLELIVGPLMSGRVPAIELVSPDAPAC